MRMVLLKLPRRFLGIVGRHIDGLCCPSENDWSKAEHCIGPLRAGSPDEIRSRLPKRKRVGKRGRLIEPVTAGSQDGSPDEIRLRVPKRKGVVESGAK